MNCINGYIELVSEQQNIIELFRPFYGSEQNLIQ